jgi:hypothetical protein
MKKSLIISAIISFACSASWFFIPGPAERAQRAAQAAPYEPVVVGKPLVFEPGDHVTISANYERRADGVVLEVFGSDARVLFVSCYGEVTDILLPTTLLKKQ